MGSWIKNTRLGDGVLEMDMYARPDGSYVHNSKDCPMLNQGQFEKLGYKKITESQMNRRRLKPCACFSESLGLKVPTRYALTQALKKEKV